MVLYVLSLRYILSFVLSDTGDVYVWGWNECGQLGLPCSDLKQSDEELLEQQESEHACSCENISNTNNSTTDQCRKCLKNNYSEYHNIINTTKSDSLHKMNADGERKITLSSSESKEETTLPYFDSKESHLFLQDVKPTQVLCEPIPLDIAFTVMHVSCGSRHSALVTGKGLVNIHCSITIQTSITYIQVT